MLQNIRLLILQILVAFLENDGLKSRYFEDLGKYHRKFLFCLLFATYPMEVSFMIVPRFSCSLWSPLDLAITAVVQFGDHQLLSYLYANPQNSVTLTHHSPRTLTKSTRWTAWYYTPCRGGGMVKPGAGLPRVWRATMRKNLPKTLDQLIFY